MSMETVMLLSATTAVQGWFSARGKADVSGTDALGFSEGSYHKSESRSELFYMGGRVLSTLPYFVSPRLVGLFAQAVSNPLYLSGGLLILNVLPTVLYFATDEDNTELANAFKTAAAVMTLANPILNGVMIGLTLATSTAPIGVAALSAGVLFGALSLTSFVYSMALVTNYNASTQEIM